LLPPRYSLAAQLQLHDERVDQLQVLIRQSDPEHTVIVTDAVGVGSYREAQTYVPEYHRVAIGRDQRGKVGEIFGDTYEPWRFDSSRPPEFGADDTTFVFLDSQIVNAFVADPERFQVVRLADGAKIYLWRGPAPQVRYNQI